ncbi:MAG TPA: hypothetical protein VJ855_06465 [Marinilabiliaceae bacterium]|nr:hypothetical protein [Marinilabiliaceae bacterium]
MKNISSHINYTKSVIAMLMVLFALTPCTVKESAYQLVDVEYQRPLNQTKSAHVSSSSCELSEMEDAFIVSSEQSQVVGSSSGLRSSSFLHLTTSVEIQDFLPEYLNKQPEDSFSPFYILYSRLKIALG